MRGLIVILLLCASAWADPEAAFAEDIAPRSNVTRGVVIRSAPSIGAERLGVLLPGQTLPLLSDAHPNWYEVRLGDGGEGYVSKRWTERRTLRDEANVAISVARAPPRFIVHVVDVGTGLAIFVEGEDFALIYDGGSNDDYSQGAGNRFRAYLAHVRPDLQRIDYLILSHPHRDHVELLPDLFDTYDVEQVWDSGALNQTCGYHAFLDRIERERLAPLQTDAPPRRPVYHNALGSGGEHRVTFQRAACIPASRRTLAITRGPAIDEQSIDLGYRAQMRFLHADGAQYSDPNENSLVVRLDLDGVIILLPGDAEAGERHPPETPPEPESIEARLLDCCRPELRSDILIAGHHGSMTSSRALFLDAVDPDHFVVSSGSKPYGRNRVVLPDPEVLREFERRGGAPAWRTDFDDAACRRQARKIGRDDRGPGGCDHIRIVVQNDRYNIGYWRGFD